MEIDAKNMENHAMSLLNLIWFTGIWLYGVMIVIIHSTFPTLSMILAPIIKLEEYWLWIIALVIPCKITFNNIRRSERGHSEFGIRDALGLQVTDERSSRSRIKAIYPEIDKRLLSNKPRNLVLGKYGHAYVSCPFTTDGVNIFTIGGVGSGKSVMLLNFLYLNLYKQINNIPGTLNWYLTDIKGELFQKLIGIKEDEYNVGCSDYVYVVQPSNRKSYGWDVFYRIHRTDRAVTETERIKMVTDIADALVCKGGDNPYFSENAKRLLSGILLYGIYKGRDFIPIIQDICRSNLDDLITSIVADAESEGYNVVLDKLKSFVGKGDNESIQDVEATMKVYLDCFSYPDIVYCLKDNPNRISCDLLDSGTACIDLAIEESMLLTYQPVFRLLSMQVLRHAESDFKESDDRMTAIIYDEAARIGEISGIDNAMATLRSRHCSLWMLYQDYRQYMYIYNEQKAKAILNLCEIKLFLSGSGDKDTTDYVSHMVGEYTSESVSYSKQGFWGGVKDVKYSQQKRPIVDGKSMVTLREKKEIIALIYGHYYRFSKLQYFKDSKYKWMIEQIHTHVNKRIR